MPARRRIVIVGLGLAASAWLLLDSPRVLWAQAAGRLTVRWLGQDGRDYVGPHGRLEPSEIQDIHLVVEGLDPARELEQVDISAEGDRWNFAPVGPCWKIAVARKARSRSADLYLEPVRAERGRPFHLAIRYRGGETAEIDFRGRTADPQLAMASKPATGRWLGQDGQDWIGTRPVVGPDGLVDACVRLEGLSIRRVLQFIRVESSGGEIWEYGKNPELRVPAEFVREKDGSRGVLYFQPQKDLAGKKLRITIGYDENRRQTLTLAAGRCDPRLAMPRGRMPELVELKLRANWLGQDGQGARPGEVRVAVAGLPGQAIRGAILTNSTGVSWLYKRDAAFAPPLLFNPRPLHFESRGGGSVDLGFEPVRNELGSPLELTLFLADGRVGSAAIEGGQCDPALAYAVTVAGKALARPGDDLHALAARGGMIELEPGVYTLSRPLDIREPATLVAPRGAELRFHQPPDAAPWTTAIKIWKGGTTLEGFRVRFDGPVRWNEQVSWGPAVMGMPDNFDNAPSEIPGLVTFRKLDVESPPAANPSGWVDAPRLMRLLRARQGVIEQNVLRGGTIEFFGGPWRIVENEFLGTPVGTISHAVFTGHGVHDVVVSGNRAHMVEPAGKTWRFLTFTWFGAHDLVSKNEVEGIGAREGDTVAWSNEPEVVLTEAYSLKYEGIVREVGGSGRLIRIGKPQGSPIGTGELVGILDGPAAGEFRRVVLALDPTTVLLDRPVPAGTLSVSIASGFLGERFVENRIDLRGGRRSEGFVLVGNHFGTTLAGNHVLGGQHAFRITGIPTEEPLGWGWSHAPFLGGSIAGNTLEDALEGGVIRLDHDPRYIRSNQGRRYLSLRLVDNVVRWSAEFLSRRPSEPAETVGITLGALPTHDPAELAVEARGNRLEAPASRPRTIPLLIHGALYNSERIVNRKLDLAAQASALVPQRSALRPARR